MLKLSEVAIQTDKENAEKMDFINVEKIGSGRYGVVAYEALRNYQPSVYCKFGFEETLEQWVLDQNDHWTKREMELFSQIKSNSDQLLVIDPMERIRQSTYAQERAIEQVRQEIIEELPTWESSLTLSDNVASF